MPAAVQLQPSLEWMCRHHAPSCPCVEQDDMIGGVFQVRAPAAHSSLLENTSRTCLGYVGACCLVEPAAQQLAPVANAQQTQKRRVKADLQYLNCFNPVNDPHQACSAAGPGRTGQRLPRKQWCWSNQHAQVLKSIRNQQVHLPQNSKVLIAVSGGQVGIRNRNCECPAVCGPTPRQLGVAI